MFAQTKCDARTTWSASEMRSAESNGLDIPDSFIDTTTFLQQPKRELDTSTRAPLSPPLRNFLLLLALWAGGTPTAWATGPGTSVAFQVSPQFQRLITNVTRGIIPHNHVDERKWGHQKEVVSGLYIKREGLRIKTHRTRKLVNHGTWKRYRIDLLDPQEQFHVHVEHVRSLPSGRLGFDIVCDAKLRVFGRVSQWQRGVQLVSLSAEADSDVRLTMKCDMAAQIDTSHAIPDVQLDPVVRDADLYIKQFRMREISQLDGPLVKRLSSSVREVVEDEIARRRTKIVQKINRQIDKNRDHMRLSINELLSLSGQGGD